MFIECFTIAHLPLQWLSGSALKTGRRKVPGSIPITLVDLAVRSFPWFSPKLAQMRTMIP